MKPQLLLVSVLCAVAFTMGYFSNATAPDIPGVQPIRVGVSEWPPDLVVYLAEERGLFDKYDVDVEIVNIDGFEDLFTRLRNNELDVWGATLLDAIIAHDSDQGWRVFMIEDFSTGADAVMSYDSSISSIEDLEGKKVGLESGTVGEFFLSVLLQRSNLSLDDLEIHDVALATIPGAMRTGTLDAGVLYEPGISESLEYGAHVVVSSRDEKGLIVDVYATTDRYAQDYPENLAGFAQAMLEAGDLVRLEPEESFKTMGELFKTPPSSLASSFERLELPTYRDNKIAFNKGSGLHSLYVLSKRAENYLIAQGVVDRNKNLESMFLDVIPKL